MALVFGDLIQENIDVVTSDIDTLYLTGAISPQFQTFAAIGDANTTYYRIISGNNSEIGLGTYTAAGTTLSRDTVLKSIISGVAGTAKITLAAGATVICTYPAEKAVIKENDGSLIVPILVSQSLSVTNRKLTVSGTSIGGWDTNVLMGTNALLTAMGTDPDNPAEAKTFDSTAIGNDSLQYLGQGLNETYSISSNIGVGESSGKLLANSGIATNFNNSIYIGNNTKVSASGVSNELVIGHNVTGSGSNTVTIGNELNTQTNIRGLVNTPNMANTVEVVNSTKTLTKSSGHFQRVEATSAISINLPPTTVPIGTSYVIDNESNFTVTVNKNDATSVVFSVLAKATVYFYLKENLTWGYYSFVPKSVTWGSAGISNVGVITSNVYTGTAPFVVTSTTPVANLSIGGNSATANALNNPNNVTTLTTVAASYAIPIVYNAAPLQLNISALNTSVTFSIIAGVDGQKLIMRIADNGTAKGLSFPATFRLIGTGISLPSQTFPSKTVYIGCVYNASAATWDVLSVNQG